MAVITREATAPIADAETASGAEVETEIAKVFTLLNGNLDTDNFISTASIKGSQLANGTMVVGDFGADAVGTDEMASSAVPKGSVKESLYVQELTSSSSLVDVGGIQPISLTPGSTSDLVICNFSVDVIGLDAPGIGGTYSWGFKIGGVDSPTVAVTRILSGTTDHVMANVMFAKVAATTSSVNVVPRYKRDIAVGTPTVFFLSQMTFWAIVLPIK